MVSSFGHLQGSETYPSPELPVTANETRLSSSMRWQLDSLFYLIVVTWFLLSIYIFFVGLTIKSGITHENLIRRLSALICVLGLTRAAYLVLYQFEIRNRMAFGFQLSRPLYVVAVPSFYYSFISIYYILMDLCMHKPGRFRLMFNINVIIGTAIGFSIVLCLFEILYQFFKVRTLPFYILVLGAFIGAMLAYCFSYIYCGTLMIKKTSAAAVEMNDIADRVRSNLMTSSSNNHAGLLLLSSSAPKIRITDENECSFSYRSDNASPALSDVSQTSDSDDETSKNGTVVEQNGRHGQKKKKNNRKKKRKMSTMSRNVHLQKIIKQCFVTAVLCLLHIVWFTVECTVYFVQCSFVDSWQWLTSRIVFGVMEIVVVCTVVFAVRNGFNRL